MLVSDSKKFVFIHVYKTAGSSLREALASYDDRDKFGVRRNINRIGSYLGVRPFPAVANSKHESVDEAISVLGADLWNEYFTFAVVRNPYDWQVSLYHYMRETLWHHQRPLAMRLSFEEYIDWRCSKEPKSQLGFLVDSRTGAIPLDYVGKLENLADVETKVREQLGVELNIPHKNRSQRSAYQDYYNRKSADKVWEVFRRDFEQFGYEKLSI